MQANKENPVLISRQQEQIVLPQDNELQSKITGLRQRCKPTKEGMKKEYGTLLNENTKIFI